MSGMSPSQFHQPVRLVSCRRRTCAEIYGAMNATAAIMRPTETGPGDEWRSALRVASRSASLTTPGVRVTFSRNANVTASSGGSPSVHFWG